MGIRKARIRRSRSSASVNLSKIGIATTKASSTRRRRPPKGTIYEESESGITEIENGAGKKVRKTALNVNPFKFWGSSAKVSKEQYGFRRVQNYRNSSDWEVHIEQCLDDRTITNKFKSLFNLVKQHIGSFYCNGAQEPDSEATKALNKLHCPSRLHDTAEIFGSTSQKHFLMRRCLSHLLVHCMAVADPSQTNFHDLYPDLHEAEYSLIPKELTAVPTAILGSPFSHKNIEHVDEAFSSLRILSAYLRPNVADEPTYKEQRKAAIDKGASLITSAFSAWEIRSINLEKRDSNLRNIFKQAADLGITMYRQPSVFRLRWKASDLNSKKYFAVSPRILRLTNEHARRLDADLELLDFERERLQLPGYMLRERLSGSTSPTESPNMHPRHSADETQQVPAMRHATVGQRVVALHHRERDTSSTLGDAYANRMATICANRPTLSEGTGAILKAMSIHPSRKEAFENGVTIFPVQDDIYVQEKYGSPPPPGPTRS